MITTPEAITPHPSPAALPAPIRAFRDAARREFGARLQQILLYGSRARGDHRPDSDWDIAIFVDGLTNAYTEYKPLAAIAGWALADDDIEINAALFPAAALTAPAPSAFLERVRREGLAL